MDNFKKFGKVEIILCLLGFFYALLSVNWLASLCAVFLPFILMKLLWKETESPLLLFAFLLQWLSITVKVFYANYYGLSFNDIDLHRYPEQIVKAYYLALISLLGMALGVHLILRTFNLEKPASILELTSEFSKDKLIKLYVLSIVVYPILSRLAFSLGGLEQPVIKILEYKWSIFFIFMLYAFVNKSIKIFLSIFLVEFILSLTGYFSAFKDYFLVIGIGAAVIYKNKFKPKYIFPSIIVSLAAIYMILAWSYVKPAYRTFLNAGSSQQISVRTNSESLTKLYELSSSLDSTAIKKGFQTVVDRISYIDFLSATLSNVPNQVAHTDGKLWLGALDKILKPRLFFPEKVAIDDSEKARLFTGSSYAGVEQGTSISLGYYAESYVDFGETGMVIILFVFGLLIGLIYKYVLIHSPNKLVGTALLLPFFFTIYSYEKALDKIFPALLLYLLVYLLVKRFALKPILTYLKS